MHVPNFPKKEIRIKELVRSIDILPTVLDITMLPALPQAQGRSLYNLMKWHKYFLSRLLWSALQLFAKTSIYSFAETKYYKHQKLDDPFYSIIRDDRYQLVYDQKTASNQLFNLGADPYLNKNIAKDNNRVDNFCLNWKIYIRINQALHQQ